MRVVSLLFLLSISLASFAQLVDVSAYRVQEVNSFEVSRRISGRVEVAQIADLGFELSGKVAKLWVERGAKVVQGEPLIALDTQRLDIEYAQLLAQRDEVQAQLQRLNKDVKRLLQLKRQDYVSSQQLELAQAEQALLAASERRVQANMAANRLQYDKSTLYAPFDASVEQRFVALGVSVNAAQPLLRLIERNAFELRVGLPSTLLNALHTSAHWYAQIDGQKHELKLLSRALALDTQSRSLELRFAFVSPPENLLHGQLAHLLLSETLNESGFWLPSSALTRGLRGLWNVYAISEKDDMAELERRDVQVRYLRDDYAFVQGALRSGDEIVAKGLQRVVVGQRVRIAQRLDGGFK